MSSSRRCRLRPQQQQQRARLCYRTSAPLLRAPPVLPCSLTKQQGHTQSLLKGCRSCGSQFHCSLTAKSFGFLTGNAGVTPPSCSCPTTAGT